MAAVSKPSVGSILVAEEVLDTNWLPPKLVHREKELELLGRRYREALSRGVAHHQLLTGGIGSGKTAIANRLGEDLQRGGRLRDLPVAKLYVNCWRRSNDRTVLHHLLRGVGVSLPDRGYALSEMLDVLEQGIRRNPRHLFVILDEVSALVRQETKLVYLLSRATEVGLGSISLFLVAPTDILPYLDAASRSSFGVTHRLALSPYAAEALVDILEARAQLALRKGSWGREVLGQLARIAASSGDARHAIELLAGSARAAEIAGDSEISAEHVRQARGSLYPTVSETRIEELSDGALLVLLAVARSLKGPRGLVTSERARKVYGAVAEEFGVKPMSRTTFWRTVKQLEREGLLGMEPGAEGESAHLMLDEVPTSFLASVVEARYSERRTDKSI